MTTTPEPAGIITSLANPRVKAVVRLRDRRAREQAGLTLVDGARELLRGLAAGVTVQLFVAHLLLTRGCPTLPQG